MAVPFRLDWGPQTGQHAGLRIAVLSKEKTL
jgi:hypothetical protein